MFQEILDNCREEKSIILGNGFGMSFDIATNEDSFNWNSLLDLCDIEEGSEIHELLQNCNFDFELAHQKLNNAIDVLELYNPRSQINEHLSDQLQYLREQLIIAVSASHPSSFVQRRSPELNRLVRNCRDFLNNFDSVFSLNYDLLLYWIRCHTLPHLGRDSFTRIDGDLVFNPDRRTNFFFPHGALFIYRDGAGAIKSESTTNYPILARLEDNIMDGVFPMCISEGTGEQKLKEIKKNNYLYYAYNEIKQLNGTIFTFGCSFLDGKDSHIIEAMCLSGADRIVVGAFNPTRTSRLRLSHEFARIQENLRTDKEIIIADTLTTSIW